MDLRDVLSGRILDQIIGKVDVAKGEYTVLVLDKAATKIVSSACKMQDVLARGVTLVESLEKMRAPMKLDAIYIMEPTLESVNKFLPDWDGSGQVKEPLYKCAHVFFTESCPDELFKKFGDPRIRRYLKALKEADICFLANESRVFTFNYPNAFLDFYKTDHGAKGPLFTKLASQLASLCYALEEYPTIRYRQGLTRIKDFADIVQNKLDGFKDENPNLGTIGRKSKSQLIILDRGFDPVTPILHHLTIQAMVYDLMKIENDQYSYKFKNQLGLENEKKAQLDESDNSWSSMRHQHLAEATKKVSSLVKDFLAEKKMSKVEGDVSLKSLHALMQQLPQYRRQLNQFMLQFNIVEEALRLYEANKYDTICRLEQTLATGEDENQEQVLDGMKLIIPALLDDKSSSENKARIVALYLLMSKGGVTPDTFARLMQHSNIIGNMRTTLLNLQYLGVNVIKDKGNASPNVLKRIPRDPSKYYPQSRWVPILQDILEYTMDEKLDYSYCAGTRGPVASDGKASGEAAHKGSDLDAKSKRGWVWQRGTGVPGGPKGSSGSQGAIGGRATIIVFIMGGVTYAELRLVYELMSTKIDENRKYADNYSIVIGSTDLVTPTKFFNLVEKLPPIVA
ncbi:Syntaxin-binding protein 1 [Oopsacas minuta]|uniref:Syntaxin-binding protein 1 n=1 Tax=Oopsacas minuta TaxID=111878 RepID=A0AAV7JDS0_9METZ|nr:Syntaxin-binding protein 1 [Oopsacas minuta]